MAMLSTIDRAYEDLANAVVVQAAEDYRNALMGKSYCHKSPERIVKETERFFRSKYFKRLTAVDGELLIEMLRQEHEERSNHESNTNTSDTQPD